MFDNDGVTGVTADQWKTYIIVCAVPCMYKLIPQMAYKSLVLLSEIVATIVAPSFSLDTIASLYRMLHEHHELFCKVYGKWAVSVNYHTSLHLPDIILDLGPPHTFWCFSYERLNGVMAGTPNSNRSVEVEVANRFMRGSLSFNSNLPTIEASNIPSSLKEFVDTPADSDPQLHSYPRTFWVLSALSSPPESRFDLQIALDKGDVRNWPIKLHHPCKRNLKIEPSLLIELRRFFEDLYGSHLDYIQPRLHKYGRCSVNGQNFSSDFNSSDRSSVVKAVFVDDENVLAPYFGVVRYFFTTTVVVDAQAKLHYLSYVTWLKFKSETADPLSKKFMITKNLYQRDRIISPRRFLCRCVLAATKANEPFYFVSELPM